MAKRQRSIILGQCFRKQRMSTDFIEHLPIEKAIADTMQQYKAI